MARYSRSRRSRRRRGNYLWQSYANTKNLSFPAPTNADEMHHGEVFQTPMIPGSGDPIHTGTAEDDFKKVPFNNDHTLERIRGSMSHNGVGYTGTTSTSWFPLTIVAVRVPIGLHIDSSENYPNLFDNTSYGNLDIIYRHDVVCDASNSEASPNWHDVDFKARRKFEVGDVIRWLYTIRQGFSSAVNDWRLEVCVNLRFLWKLKV